MRYLAICLLLLGCTENQKRKIKTASSNYIGGLNRICTVYSMDGTLLRNYKGSFDIEESQVKVQFDLRGKRISLYNATVICEEE